MTIFQVCLHIEKRTPPRSLFPFSIHYSFFIIHFSLSYPHSILQTQAEQRKQARSAQRAAGMAQRLRFTPAAER